MRDLWEKLPYWVKVLLLGAALVLVVRVARADSTPLTIRQLNSLVRDNVVPDSPTYGLLLAGHDGTNSQLVSLNSSGQLQVGVVGTVDTELPAAAALSETVANPTTPMVGAALMGWNGTDWGRVDAAQSGDAENPDRRLWTNSVFYAFDGSGYSRVSQLLDGTDDTANTQNGLWTYSGLMGFDGTDWDRFRVSNDGDGVDVGDGTDDGLLIVLADLVAWNGTTHDRVDSVDTGALVSEICDSGTGSTLCADVQTAGADNVANTENGVWTYSALSGFDGTTWDRILADAGALRFTPYDSAGGVVSIALITDDMSQPRAIANESVTMGYDEDDANFDRIYSYDTDGDNVATEAEGVTLAVTGFNQVYDLTGANFDRMSTGMVTGAGLPGANVQLGVDGASSCMAALAVGYYRITPVAAGQSIAYCCRTGADGGCTATTTSAPYVDGQYYYETVTDAAANDVVCCINASGTNTTLLNATPLTF